MLLSQTFSRRRSLISSPLQTVFSQFGISHHHNGTTRAFKDQTARVFGVCCCVFVPDGTAFEVKDPRRLEQDILPKYFRHSRFQSLVRQLNFYSFKKISKVNESQCSEINTVFVDSTVRGILVASFVQDAFFCGIMQIFISTGPAVFLSAPMLQHSRLKSACSSASSHICVQVTLACAQRTQHTEHKGQFVSSALVVVYHFSSVVFMCLSVFFLRRPFALIFVMF